MISYDTHNIAFLLHEVALLGIFAPNTKHWSDGWLDVNHNVLLKLQESILPLVKYTLIVLGTLFLLLLIIYLVSIYMHHRQKKYVEWKTARCQSLISSLLDGAKSPADLKLTARERNCFRDTLIAKYSKQGVSGKNTIRNLYKRLRFFDHDIQQLKSHIWWKKIEAIERLGALELPEAEDHVLPLLIDKRSEVRFSALRMLASVGSRKLGKMLPEIFADNSRWAYRFLVNTLFNTSIPIDSLKPLASSSDRDYRKAAAILLGKKGSHEAIPILRRLAGDEVKDVRRETVSSLGRIGSVKAIPVLSEKANDDNSQVRAGVARALGELKDTDALFLLDRLADDPDFDVRFQAFLALDQFGKSGEDIIRKYEVKYPEMTREFLGKNRGRDYGTYCRNLL